MLVLASEMPGACRIDSLQLLCGSDVYNHGIFYNARILACHTTVTELESTFDDNYAGNRPDTVMARSPLTLEWQNETWHGLGFDTPWQFNGADNYILEFRWQGDDNNSVYDRGWYTVGNRACNASSSTATQGVPRGYMPCFRIFYDASGIGGSVLIGSETGPRLVVEPSVVSSGFARVSLSDTRSPGPSLPLSLSLSDPSGRIILHSDISHLTSDIVLDLCSLPPGAYLLRAGTASARILILD